MSSSGIVVVECCVRFGRPTKRNRWSTWRILQRRNNASEEASPFKDGGRRNWNCPSFSSCFRLRRRRLQREERLRRKCLDTTGERGILPEKKEGNSPNERGPQKVSRVRRPFFTRNHQKAAFRSLACRNETKPTQQRSDDTKETDPQGEEETPTATPPIVSLPKSGRRFFLPPLVCVC